MGSQELHHLCLRFKHAFRARHARTVVRDTPLSRSIVGLMQREGFLVSVMPGDKRGPFVDIIAATKQSRLPIASCLTQSQRERIQVMQQSRDTVLRLHRDYFESDGSQRIDQIQIQQYLDRVTTSNNNNSHTEKNGRFNDLKLLQSIQVVPSESDLPRIPVAFSQLSPEPIKQPAAVECSANDLLQVTWNRDKMLWADLRYDSTQTPALSDMFLVSRGSRRVLSSLRELDSVLNGHSSNQWNAGEIGSVVFVRHLASGQIMTGRDALLRSSQIQNNNPSSKWNGEQVEVLCVAK